MAFKSLPPFCLTFIGLVWYTKTLMSPKAEIWLPGGISKGDLQTKMSEFGGRVLNLKEVLPVCVEDISPFSLADYLEDKNPDFNFGQDPTDIAIFSQLRSLPLQEQKELLIGYYTEGVKDFSNGEHFGKALAEINNIPWFKPEKDPEIASLQGLIDECYARLNLPRPPHVRIIRDDWDVVENAVWENPMVRKRTLDTIDAIDNAAESAARNEAWDTMNTVLDVTFDSAERGEACNAASWDAAEDMVRNAEWIIVEDLMPQRGFTKGNPFEPLTEIYKLGLWPIGEVVNPEGKEEFVIFVPPLQKST